MMHFESQKERLKYLKGQFEEIVPKEVPKEKPKEKPKKRRKKDEVQTEQS